MARSVRTETILGAQDARVPTRRVGLPPSVFLDRHSVRTLGMPTGTLAVDGEQNAHAADNTATTGFHGNQRIRKHRNGAGANGANAVRPAVPEVSLGHSPSFFPRQEWEGRVTAIHNDEFDARLRDLTGGGRHFATIEMEEIGPEDRERLSVGSKFHWVMGYERSPGGTRSYVSRIVFLDPPRLTVRDWKAGEEWADRLRAKWNLG